MILLASVAGILLPKLLKLTAFVGVVGSYFSFCSFTTILNLTVVVLVGVVLSETVNVTILSPSPFCVSTTPVIVWLSGLASVAVSLVNHCSLLPTLLNHMPFGIPPPLNSLILPVLS